MLNHLKFKPILLLACFSIGLSTLGQVATSMRIEQSWSNDRVSVLRKSRDGLVLSITSSINSHNRDITLPKGAINGRLIGEDAWAIVPSAGDHVSFSVYRMLNLIKWEKYCWYSAKPNSPQLCDVFPLHNGDFLLTLKKGDLFAINNKQSWIAIASVATNDELIPKSLITLPGKEGPDKSFLMLSMCFNNSMITVDDHYVLASLRNGVFHIFDNLGNLQRSVALFPDVIHKTHLKELLHVVLCAQPRNDGKILIASRTEDACLVAIKMFPRDNRMLGWQDSAQKGKNIAAIEAEFKMFPEILWWTLDPRTGKFEHEYPPANVPMFLTTPSSLSMFNYVFNQSGNLDFPYMKLKK